MRPPERRTGPIAFMARHPVAANLLMALLILGGLLMSSRITQEVFPSFELDSISVTVPLPGSKPEESEQSVTIALEKAIEGIAGIKTISGRGVEGSGVVIVDLTGERDRRIVYDEIEQAVSRITTFPEDAEDPQIELAARSSEVMQIQIYGDVSEIDLRMAAEQVRARLLRSPRIGQVEIANRREMELHVEVPQGALRAHGLTLSDVARVLRESGLDRSAGLVETPSGDLLISLEARREGPAAFAALPLVTDRAGTILRLGDIATIARDFNNDGRYATFNGKPAIQLDVTRTGSETPLTVSEAVRATLPEAMRGLPEAIDAAILNDSSEVYRDRMNLLLKNGFLGLVLVLVLLSLFLEARLAFWVAVGIPTAFLGTFLLLAPTGASINMVTMFAFILALGIVVDDAIVVGENIHERLEQGMSRIDAAIEGARDIAVPLAFSILTNIVAFLPLAMIPGMLGLFFMWIPLVVTAAFLLSWMEALYVLPAHLAAIRDRGERAPGRLARVQARFAGGLDWTVRRVYAPLLGLALSWRYATAAAMIGGALVVMAVPMSGKMGFSLFPPVPQDYASATAVLPAGAPGEAMRAVRDRLVAAAERAVAANGGAMLSRGIHAEVRWNQVIVRTFLTPPEVRPVGTAAFARAWRAETPEMPELRSLRYSATFGGPGGQASVEVRLSHPDSAVLGEAARRLVDRLGAFEQVRDPEDGFSPGKAELEFRLTEAGRALGLTAGEVGLQVRAAFQGIEAYSQQEGPNEIAVRVRLPKAERDSLDDIESLLIRTPEGGEVPLYQIATARLGEADADIRRTDGRRTVTVTANVVPDSATPIVAAALEAEVLPALAADIPGLDYVFGGRQEATAETTDSFVRTSVPLTLALMYALLAIPFRSYVQPVLVLAAIPFGAVGAVIGHMVMGMSLSMISVFGVIALSGVVINAAIVMIDHANRLRREGTPAFEAIRRAGLRRFRPIMLTTMTTFCGLMPMILETSAQARFLIPMAVSLGFGILFATLIVMLFIPALYLIAEDLRWLANPRPRPVPARGVPAE